MSPRSVEEIIADFHISLQQATLTGKLNPAKLHFSDDILVVGSSEQVEGKPQVLKFLEEKLLPNLHKVVIQHQLFDKNSGCSFTELVTKSTHEVIPAAIWHKVKNGVIYEVRFFFDTSKWEKSVGLRRAG